MTIKGLKSVVQQSAQSSDTSCVLNDPHVRASAPGIAAVFSGIRWGAIGQVFANGIRFGVSITLARLLSPEDFGLLGMALAVTGFLGIFQALGTGAVIIQRRELSAELSRSLYTLNVAVGLLLGGGLVVGAPFVAMIYDTPSVVPIIQALGVTLVITSFGLVPFAVLNREMSFDQLVQIELVTVVIQGTSAIMLAYAGWKVWALVAANIVSATVSTVLRCWASPWRSQWGFHWDEVKRIMGFSLHVTGMHIFDYWFRNVDKVIIGRFIGTASLGYYWMAYNLYMMPVESIASLINRVMFPAFSRIQDDDAQLRSGFLRATGGIALITFPLMTGLGIVATPFVLGVLGEQWSPIIPLIMILSPIGMLHSIAATTGNIYLAKGRSDWAFWWNVGAGTAIMASYVCGLPWGIVGVSSAYAMIMLPLTYLSFIIPFRLINLSFLDLLDTLRPYITATVVMAGLVVGARFALEHAGYPPLLVLTICVPVGAVAYTSIILFQRPAALSDLMRLLPERVQRLACGSFAAKPETGQF